MPLFQYKGRNQHGEAVAGRLEAVSADAVASQLSTRGVIPVDVTLARAGPDVLGAIKQRLSNDKVEFADLILFSRQMYTLLKAGVPIMQALRGLEGSTHNATLTRTVGEISDSLDAGLDLTSAIKPGIDLAAQGLTSIDQVVRATFGVAQ